jgi:hypothetical protein
MSHPTVELQYMLGATVEIDEEIAPIVQAIWQLGLRTSSSCQGDPGGERAHLIMPPEDLIRLLNLVSALAPEDDYDEGDEYGFSRLYYRMAPWQLVTHDHPDRWGYQTSFLREDPGGYVVADTMVDFPHDDLPVLEDILTRAVAINRGNDEGEGSP